MYSCIFNFVSVTSSFIVQVYGTQPYTFPKEEVENVTILSHPIKETTFLLIQGVYLAKQRVRYFTKYGKG